MVWILTAAAALAVGALRGGSLRHYARRPFRGGWMLCAALLLALVQARPGRGPVPPGGWAALLPLGLLALFVARNLHRRGMKWVALGAGIQVAACLMGGGALGAGPGGGLTARWRDAIHMGHGLTDGLAKLSYGLCSGIAKMMGDVGAGLLRGANWFFRPGWLSLAGGALACVGMFMLVMDIMRPPARAQGAQFRTGA